ncbi:MFS transporter [Novosphingobium sp. G106]|uniref:MFS transporter n=1 Tax=Novosphingobium sp. G106 TaxID=2849500 RepID=UPI001C2CEB80|nr:MFS transporter [Novosphingobium sp. G106]MBV1688708.1 MFS transporter [Novosphingobium sp. G106]
MRRRASQSVGLHDEFQCFRVAIGRDDREAALPNERENGRIALATTAHDGAVAAAPPARITVAAWYALALLFAANALNYVDRHIVSILAQAIKTDLKLDDADLGFLLGTAFAVFYSVVGIAMGRISDMLPRKKVMAFGLALWSAMTALGGASSSFAMLGAARLGVGVGEAVANPCGHSLVSDIFPQRNRALVLSILLTGVFVGTASAMVLGGWFLQDWKNVCHMVPIAGSCALPAWKAALFGVGLPGLPLSLLLLTLREPPRHQGSKGGTFAILFAEFAAALPPLHPPDGLARRRSAGADAQSGAGGADGGLLRRADVSDRRPRAVGRDRAWLLRYRHLGAGTVLSRSAALPPDIR